MVALGHGPASAQSFQGSVIGTPNNAIVGNSVPGQTTVTVTAPTAIVNWQPTDTAAGSAPITFQNAGTTATFESTGGNYTVLNRIIPAGAGADRSVLLNGTINSFIGEATSGNRGGAVWFYSPNGLIVGSQASINVGSLLLTTRNLTDNEFLSGGGVYNFGAADNSRSTVTIEAGAEIGAASLIGSSYVAVVAPRIVQGGDVRANGSVAYVAAEQASITISNSLFDIQVQSGSAVDPGTPGDGVTLRHTGATGGPASASPSDPRAIYMVAIPKNVAITMLVGGNVGYDAGMASVENGRVVLSAGSSVDPLGNLTNGPASGVGASLSIDGGNFSSRTTASARTDAIAATGTGGTLAFSDGLSLTGGRSALLQVGDGATATVGGSLRVATLNQDDAGNAIRGTAAVDVGANATLSVSGNLGIDASHSPEDEAAQGGFARLAVRNGASASLQSVTVTADASSSTGAAQGGDAILSLTGASLSSQEISVSANGFGGASAIGGGDGRGGNIDISIGASGGISATFSSLNVSARGVGGAFEGLGAGGSGTGGTVGFSSAGSVSMLGISLDASADGGSSGDVGGNATGGAINFNVTGGTIDLLSSIRLTAEANGGGGISGGNAIGGAVDVTMAGNGRISGNGFLDIRASGYGGEGRYSSDTDSFGDGGDASGGTIDFSVADDSTGSGIELGYGIQFDANGFGGRSSNFSSSSSAGFGNGGTGTGGRVSVATGGADIEASPYLNLAAYGQGGSTDRTQGNGGASVGGEITLDLAGSNVTTDRIGLDVSAFGGSANESGYGSGGGSGGSAIAGVASLLMGGGAVTTQSVSINAAAYGGSGGGENSSLAIGAGDGGAATGGQASFEIVGGSLTLSEELRLDVSANGGSGGDAFDGGPAGSGGSAMAGGADGTGGATIRIAAGATVDTPNLVALASAYGGNGGYSDSGQSGTSAAGNGGDAAGGIANVTLTGSVLTASRAIIDTTAGGGSAGFVEAASVATSGIGNGGDAQLIITDGNASFGELAVIAEGFGGGFSGVPSGGAQGGTARIAISGGNLEISDVLTLSARSQGVAGTGIAPTVTGGLAEFAASGNTTLAIGASELVVDASASLLQSGQSDRGFFSSFLNIGTFGVGEGQAIGGTATFTLDGTSLEIGTGLTLDAGGYVETPGASAQGGSASLSVVNGGALTVDGAVDLLAAGIAADGDIFGTGQGGTGAGGSASLRVDGGRLASDDIFLDARGTGGASTLLTAGGGGTGGTVAIDIVSGSGQAGTVEARSLTARADGVGGSALVDPDEGTSGTDGGTGVGGTVAMAVSGGLTLEGGEGGSMLILSANGAGGDGFAGGIAGAGIGGSVSLATEASAVAGTAIAVDNIVLSANGNGGGAIDPASYIESDLPDLRAASGGRGSGGEIFLSANAGTITANGIAASAQGTGQAGADALIAGSAGGNGGDGEGGAFALSMGGGALAAPLSVLVGATAGAGGNGAAGGAGGAGGDAAGGSFAIGLTGNAASFALPGGLTLDLGALAGNGGNGGNTSSGNGGNGGDGGSATGGDLALATAVGGASLSLGGVALNATATGGNGGAGGTGTVAGMAGLGGNGTGGSANFSAGPGTLAIGNTDIQLDGRGGDGRIGGAGTGGAFDAIATGGTIEAGAFTVSSSGYGGNGTSGAGGGGFGGNINIATRDTEAGLAGRITTGSASFETSAFGGGGATAGGAAAGSIDIAQQGTSAAGLIQFSSLYASAQGALADSAASAVNLVTSGGSIAITGNTFIDAVNAARVDGGGIIATGGSVDIFAGQSATIGNIAANRVFVSSGGGIAVTGQVSAANDIRLNAGGAVSGATLRAGDDIIIDADSITLDGLATTGDGDDNENGYGGDGLGNILLSAGNGIAVTSIDAAGDVTAVDGAGGIVIDRLLSGGNVGLSSETGAVTVATDLQAGGNVDATGTNVTLRSLGALSVTSITATTGDIVVETGGAFDAGQMNAANSLQLVVQGLATLSGTVDATAIDIAAHDIALMGSSTLIGVNTDTITLTNIGPRRTQVGGADASDAWSLSNDEFGRLSAHVITIAATGEGPSRNMTVGRLDIIGAAGSDTGTRRRNLTGSDLILTAAGSIRVDGAVALTNAGGDDRLTLNAGNDIMVDTASGSIVLTGQGNAPGGTLAMNARTIFVGTAQAWTDINALPGLDAKSNRLGNNDGISNPEGFLRANAIEFGAARGLFIQNSGTNAGPPDERAGFTVGAGGVTIFTEIDDGPPLQIAINGRQVRSDGGFATGTALIPLLQLRGEGSASMTGFDPRSTANGCLITGMTCGVTMIDPGGIPQQDVIHFLEPDDPLGGSNGLLQALNPPIIQFADTIGLSDDRVIDEPVTGTANESLWLGGDAGGASDLNQQVTGTRKDDDEQQGANGPAVDEQVTGTRNENLDEQVTGTRNDNGDEPQKPNP